jgi:inhibitor of cysteine peptidase
MKVNLGQEFTISLEASPTTGYTWEANYDAHFLQLKEQNFEPLTPKGPESARPLGSPGKTVFTFIPIKSGQTTITMIYQRTWEKTPAQEEAFTVIINDGGGS